MGGLPAAVALCLIQRGVSLGAQRLRRAPWVQHAHTDAHLDRRVLEGVLKALGDRSGALRIGVRQHQRELVTSDSVGPVGGPRVTEDLGDCLQDRVAVRVSVAVVDELEVVDVQECQRERVSVAHRGRDRRGKLLLESPLVGEVRQPVTSGAP